GGEGIPIALLIAVNIYREIQRLPAGVPPEGPLVGTDVPIAAEVALIVVAASRDILGEIVVVGVEIARSGGLRVEREIDELPGNGIDAAGGDDVVRELCALYGGGSTGGVVQLPAGGKRIVDRYQRAVGSTIVREIARGQLRRGHREQEQVPLALAIALIAGEEKYFVLLHGAAGGGAELVLNERRASG